MNLTPDNHQLSQSKTELPESENLQLTANLDALDEAIAGYLRASLAANTQRAYPSDIAHFTAWGGSIPASPEQVARYLADSARTLAYCERLERRKSDHHLSARRFNTGRLCGERPYCRVFP